MLKSTSDFAEDVNESLEEVDKSVNHLKNLVQNLDFEANENYLKRFLYGSNFNVEVAFHKIKATYDHIVDHRQWYSLQGPLQLKSFIDTNIRAMLPDCDKEGRPIYLVKNGNIDVSKQGMLDVVAVDDVWMESILAKNPEAAAKGLCVIMDIKDQSWKLSKWIQPDHIRNYLKKIDNMPFKDYKVHVVNNSWWISLALKIIWPFMPQKFKDMIKFHFDNLDSLYEFIDKKVLPIDYGGLKEINYAELYNNLYKRNDDIFKSFDSYRNLKK